MKKIWKKKDGQFRTDGKTYSIDGLNGAIRGSTSFKQINTQFAAANVTPGCSYDEGKA